MSREELLDLLPCYLCGELPPQVMNQVRQALDADPELLEILDSLDVSQRECGEALQGTPPSEIGWAEPRRSSAISRPWSGLAVLAVAVFAFGAWLLPSMDPLEGLLVQVAETHQSAPDQHPDWIAQRQPRQLAQAFEDQGLSPMMAMVADLSSMDLELLGGHVVGGGTVVVYEDAQGRRFECHMAMDGPTGEAAQVLSSDGKPDLEVHRIGDATAVVWREQGMVCVLVSTAHDAVVALAQAKVWKG